MTNLVTFHNIHILAKRWFTGQMFMSALTNAPLIVDICFENNSIVRCCFYKGNFYNYRTFLSVVNCFYLKHYIWELTSREKKSLVHNEIVKDFLEAKILKIEVITHPYNKNSDKKSICCGPMWDMFIKQIASQEDIQLYYIDDIRDNEDGTEQRGDDTN